MLTNEMPGINKRIKKIIETKADGNKTAFGRKTGIYQQRITRLFTRDKKTGLYPIAPTDILVSILNRYKEIDARWLMTGEGYMTKEDAVKDVLRKEELVKTEKDYIIELQRETISSLKEQIAYLKGRQI